MLEMVKRGVIVYAKVQNSSGISIDVMKKHFLKGLKNLGPKERVLLIPPKQTKKDSLGSFLTTWACTYYKDKVKAILLPTDSKNQIHKDELAEIYPKIDPSLFVFHDNIHDVFTLGTVTSDIIEEVSEKTLSFSYKVQVNNLLISGGFDLILSISNVFPDEIVGNSGFTHAIYTDVGGIEGVHKSHYLGAVYGMERIIGKTNSPVRAILDYAHTQCATNLPIAFALFVSMKSKEGIVIPAGLFMGDDRTCFDEACQVAQKVNITELDEPLKKVVVYLEDATMSSLWESNNAICRIKNSMKEGGELIIIAPFVKTLSTDKEKNQLIKKFGYTDKNTILDAVSRNEELKKNLLTASHLINSSSDKRFTISYSSQIKEKDILLIGYEYLPLEETRDKYIFDGIKDGFNTAKDGKEYYFISNPLMGLWTLKNHEFLTT